MSIGEDTNILSFDDALTVRGYAIPAMQWACGSGLVTGIAQNSGMLGRCCKLQAGSYQLCFQKLHGISKWHYPD